MAEIDDRALAAQEACFTHAFAVGDVALARPLYHPDVVYVSPTVRLFGWPARIEGVERTLEFIALTVANVRDVTYRAVEWAVVAGGQAAFVLFVLLVLVAAGAPLGVDDPLAARQRMVTEQIESRGMADARVLAAMRKVPRHEFVPEAMRASDGGAALGTRGARRRGSGRV